jgi:hypothetical protein
MMAGTAIAKKQVATALLVHDLGCRQKLVVGCVKGGFTCGMWQIHQCMEHSGSHFIS